MAEKILTLYKTVSAILLAMVFAVMAIGVGICIALGFKPYAIMSGSMEPAVPTGSLVIINTRALSYDRGDIIAYALQNGVVVVHRIHDVSEDGYITKGDANETDDFAPIKPEQVIGKALCLIPRVGCLYFNNIARCIAILVFVILIAPQFINPRKGGSQDG